uniref:Uncharacterized protein n=1 Tax=Chromera velia CCMP2878 TaxID=1169474 RepID=A0A0G4GDL1_9ALVE|eukprot:Cvel_21424.t1-p1 / transcript=Cvel_21424.t1 / gene=Cvel_21424 / organism=Chromera_velia_CCMP2878 / gene_product=hypothetical protein / transcript_product=hypothetical protein / location=Cvel_scaffold2008:8759-8995(-) / protein_length=79 / sequence_SO=supercontig / SO=protein_coding / is_pseudo=false
MMGSPLAATVAQQNAVAGAVPQTSSAAALNFAMHVQQQQQQARQLPQPSHEGGMVFKTPVQVRPKLGNGDGGAASGFSH